MSRNPYNSIYTRVEKRMKECGVLRKSQGNLGIWLRDEYYKTSSEKTPGVSVYDISKIIEEKIGIPVGIGTLYNWFSKNNIPRKGRGKMGYSLDITEPELRKMFKTYKTSKQVAIKLKTTTHYLRRKMKEYGIESHKASPKMMGSISPDYETVKKYFGNADKFKQWISQIFSAGKLTYKELAKKLKAETGISVKSTIICGFPKVRELKCSADKRYDKDEYDAHFTGKKEFAWLPDESLDVKLKKLDEMYKTINRCMPKKEMTYTNMLPDNPAYIKLRDYEEQIENTYKQLSVSGKRPEKLTFYIERSQSKKCGTFDSAVCCIKAYGILISNSKNYSHIDKLGMTMAAICHKFDEIKLAHRIMERDDSYTSERNKPINSAPPSNRGRPTKISKSMELYERLLGKN